MSLTISQNIGVIDATVAEWEPEVRRQIASGSNFLLILNNEPDAISKFCAVFGMESDCDPTRMPRHSLFSLSQYIEVKDFDELLRAQDCGKRVVFIDQLDLALNKPPRVRHYLVYCPVWGIISQHDELRQARESLEEYSQSLSYFRRHNPDAAIYRFVNGKWQMLEIP